jgi:hypothetical protein
MVQSRDPDVQVHPPVPALSKLGVLVMGMGALNDLVEHTFVFRPSAGGGFAPEEHLAHLIVVVGMALVLGGIVRDGIRTSRRSARHQEAQRHALR